MYDDDDVDNRILNEECCWNMRKIGPISISAAYEIVCP